MKEPNLQNDNHFSLTLEQERLNRVLEASNTGIWEWNIQTHQVYYAPRWKELLGYKDDELENAFSTWEDLLHPEDKERMLKNVSDFMQNPQGHFEHKFRMKHKEGHYVWILNRSAITLDKHNKPLYMSGSHLDITQQVVSETEIQQINQKFKDFFENSPLGKSITSKEGKLSINKRFSEIVGYSEEELNQKNWKEITHPDDISGSEEAIQKMLSSPEPVLFRKRYIHKDGHIVWTSVNSVAQRDKNGIPIQFLTTIADITNEIETTRQLKESEARLKFLIQSLTIPLCQLDINGNFQWMNDQFIKKFGYTPEEMKHINQWWEFAYPDEEYRKWVIENWNTSVENAQINQTDIKSDEYTVRCKDGTNRIIIIGGLPLNNGFLATFIDITDIKKSEQKLLHANDQLRSSNKELEQFAYIASHDLQEPLRKIKNYMELFENRYKENFDDRAKKYLEIVTGGVARMQMLIDDLLQLSRISTRGKNFEAVDLNIVIQNVLELLELKIEERKAIINVFDLPVINADYTQMVQLFQNLISNAIKYCNINPVIEIQISSKRNMWQISIKDNGIGFDEKYKDRIFIAFQRLHTRTEYEGSGIGLAVCKKIVERHGGNISVHSIVGKGSIFIIALPKKTQNV